VLLTNQHLDKLVASRIDFTTRGMLVGSILSRAVASLSEDDIDDGKVVDGLTALTFVQLARTPHKWCCNMTVVALAEEVHVPHLQHLIRYFLFSQLFPDDPHNPEDVPATNCPQHDGSIHIFNSVAATFYAPSDPSGISGM
ncbi:uncharacterized protein BJ212DRAFT_1207099, partial [Suillus subaureus]